jgi:hypothetical protein
MDAKGQSILEIVVVLPFLFILVGMLFRLNLGLQMAINNLQYSRSQLYVLTGNSPEYPRLSFRHKLAGSGRSFAEREQDLMVLGVSDPKALSESEEEGSMPAIPQKQRVTRAGVAGGSEEAGEPEKRTNVRVRETSAICTQMNSVSKNVNFDTSGVVGLKDGRWPFRKLVCQYEKRWIGEYDEQ